MKRPRATVSCFVITLNILGGSTSGVSHIDPHAAAERPLYECLDCGRRVEDASKGRLCTCGGYLQNIGQARGE
jgi:hypothetical protein